MKKMILISLAGCFIMACNNESADKTKDEKMDSKDSATTSNINYPFKADYSADFKMGDPNQSKFVLDFIKCWVDNRMDDMKPFLADSVSVEFSDGEKFNGPADSLIKTGKQVRAMYSSIVSTMDGWMPVHSNDKNEDFVLIWGKDITTDTKGKVDSSRGHSYWLIKNNKIAAWSEFSQKLTPMAMPAANKK